MQMDQDELEQNEDTLMYDVANAMRGILLATMMIEVLQTNFINIPCERIWTLLLYVPTYFGLN